MNFERDLSSADSYLDGRVVLSLVLLREWSRMEEGSVATVRGCAFVLEQLKRLSTASAEHEELEQRDQLQLSEAPQEYAQLLLVAKERMGEEFTHQLAQSVREVSQEVKSYMDLFDQVSTLVQARDQHSLPPRVGSEYRNCVFGCFIRRCVVEYRSLTFTQLLRVHSIFRDFVAPVHEKGEGQGLVDGALQAKKTNCKQLSKGEQDYLAMLEQLHFPQRSGQLDEASSVQSLLSLVALHHAHGHHREALDCIRSVMQLTQDVKQGGGAVHQALSWLVEVEGPTMAAGEMDPYLRLLVEQREGEGRGGVWDHSAHTSSLLLSAWSRLRLARGLIGSATETPKTVLSSVLEGVSAAFQPTMPLSMVTAALSLQCSYWENRGCRMVGLLYCGLQCHVMSHDCIRESHPQLGHTHADIEGLALSIATIAYHLADQGDVPKALNLVRAMKAKLEPSSPGYPVLCVCYLELQLRQLLLCNNLSKLCNHCHTLIEDLSVYDCDAARYWHLVMKKENGHFSEVVREVNRLASTQPSGKMAARLQLLLAEVHQLSGNVSQALVVATETVRQCAEHHWKALVAQGKLMIAQLQLHCGSAVQCCKLVTQDCLPHFLAQGSLLDQSRAWLCLAQGTIMTGGGSVTAVSEALPLITEAVLGFRRCGSVVDLRNTLPLLAGCHGNLGHSKEQDSVLTELSELGMT